MTGSDAAPAEIPPFVGILLAGGRSTRMGTDKAFLLYRGRPLIDHMLSVFESCSPSRVVVSGAGKTADAIPDRWPDLGPLGGIASVLAELQETPPLVLVVPIDMPLMTGDLLLRLLREAATHSDANAIHFIGHELPALFRAGPTLRGALRTLLRDNVLARERSFRRLLAMLAARGIAEDISHEAFLNVNSPEEWKKVAKGDVP